MNVEAGQTTQKERPQHGTFACPLPASTPIYIDARWIRRAPRQEVRRVTAATRYKRKGPRSLSFVSSPRPPQGYHLAPSNEEHEKAVPHPCACRYRSRHTPRRHAHWNGNTAPTAVEHSSSGVEGSWEQGQAKACRDNVATPCVRDCMSALSIQRRTDNKANHVPPAMVCTRAASRRPHSARSQGDDLNLAKRSVARKT